MVRVYVWIATLVLAFSALATAADGSPRPANCVNPGGSCDGSLPCCGSSVNFCVRGECQPVPEGTKALENVSPHGGQPSPSAMKLLSNI